MLQTSGILQYSGRSSYPIFVRKTYKTISGQKPDIFFYRAIAGLGGTSVANLEPIRDNTAVKTIAGITKLSYFEWPITGDYAGYIQVQTLPHVGP